MAIEFGDAEYTYDGAAFKLADLPLTSVINGLTRAFNHVMSNEATAKVAAARKKAETPLTEDQEKQIVADARAAYVASILNGTWGEAGNRTRAPAANRLDQIRNMLANNEVRAVIARAKYPEGDAKDSWIVTKRDGSQVQATLSDIVHAYMNHAQHGAERTRLINEQAQNKYDAELRDAELRRERKAAEAGKGLDLDL